MRNKMDEIRAENITYKDYAVHEYDGIYDNFSF